ncbi:MAG: energy transducer TonB [Bacteroidales bacterium]|nr:energy transducer TonB [Bacteroidales bacterium]
MTRGKKICSQLKAVRQQIADENGIPFEVKECTHQGDCRGTCPRCESEVRYLERELTHRLSAGKVATVAGLTLSLVACGGSGGSSLATDTPLAGDTSLPAGSGDSFDDDSLYVEGFEDEPEVETELGIVEPMTEEELPEITMGDIEIVEGEGEVSFVTDITATDDNPEEEIYVFVSDYPEFPGGEKALYEYIDKNLHYPEEALRNGTTGMVVIRFVVEKDGSLSNVSIAREIGNGCGAEAKRIVKGMPKWKPGRQDGKTVRTEFTLPVRFTLP